MEEENSVFGVDAGNTDKLDAEEKFSIYHNEKDNIQNNIKISAEDLTAFFDLVSKDIPDPSEEEVNKGIEKILENTHPATEKTNKSKRVTLRVLFIAALLSIVSFSCLCVLGSSHDISIENGFLTFAKDTVKIVFFEEGQEEYIDVKTLLENLEANGYKDILLPQELYNYKSSVPVYSKGAKDVDANDRVEFELCNDASSYSFRIEKNAADKLISDYYSGLNNAETVIVDDLYIYIFKFDSGLSSILFVNDGYNYFIQSDVPLSEMIHTAQTIVKTEE